MCVEIELDALAVNTLLQSHHVNDIEGTAGSVAFDTMPQVSSTEYFYLWHPGLGIGHPTAGQIHYVSFPCSICDPQASLEEMLGGQVSTLASYDETALASAAFRVLRSMVNAWLREVSQFRNIFADYQGGHSMLGWPQ